MQLNLDLVRELLLYIEENGDGKQGIYDISIKGYTKNEISYHLKLISEIGYIEYMKVISMNNEEIVPKRLTMKGHSYIENIKNKYIWEEIKRELEVKGLIGASIDIVKDYVNKYIRNKLDI